MTPRDGGVWELFLPGLPAGSAYKYAIAAQDGQTLWKADPYAVFTELRPASASIVRELTDFVWSDGEWLAHRRRHKVYDSPLNIYELHFGSFKNGRDGPMSYREAQELLLPYVKEMGFTHVELMEALPYFEALRPRFRLIPFSSIGQSAGLLPVFRPDALRIDGKERADLLVGLCPMELSTDGQYSAVI